MEWSHGRIAITLSLLVFSSACSNSQTGGSGSQAGPKQVVGDFLEAVRTGDDKQAAALLTPLAREKTEERHLVVAPPGSDTARFEVGEVEQFDGEAHVASDWTDLDTDGQPHTDRIVWRLRAGSEGWRIAGMATKVFADREPIVLNFEEPDEMALQQQLAEEEIARRETVPAAPAKK